MNTRLWPFPVSAHSYGHHRSQEHPSTEDRQPATTLGVILAIQHTTQILPSGDSIHQNLWKLSSTLGSHNATRGTAIERVLSEQAHAGIWVLP